MPCVFEEGEEKANTKKAKKSGERKSDAQQERLVYAAQDDNFGETSARLSVCMPFSPLDLTSLSLSLSLSS